MARVYDMLRDPLVALSLLSRVPIRLPEEAYARSARAAWAYPLVGVVTALVMVTAASLAQWIGLSAIIAAVLGIGAVAVITGAMHEDGLADCADGFWGGWDPAMRLKIMKDSQIGTYGVMALIGIVGLRVLGVAEILQAPGAVITIVSIQVASRAVMPVVMTSLPFASPNGLSVSVGRVSVSGALAGALIGVFALLLGFGSAGLWLAVLVGIACIAASKIAMAKVGGQTGDVIGAHQQIAETVLWLAAASLVSG